MEPRALPCLLAVLAVVAAVSGPIPSSAEEVSPEIKCGGDPCKPPPLPPPLPPRSPPPPPPPSPPPPSCPPPRPPPSPPPPVGPLCPPPPPLPPKCSNLPFCPPPYMPSANLQGPPGSLYPIDPVYPAAAAGGLVGRLPLLLGWCGLFVFLAV